MQRQPVVIQCFRSIGLVFARDCCVILPQAAASSLAPCLNALGTASAAPGSNGTVGESLFQNLLAAISSDLPNTAAIGLVADCGSKTETSATTRKAGSDTKGQDQQNAVPAPVAVDTAPPDPLLLSLFSLTPVQPLTSDTIVTNAAPEEQNGGTVTGVASIAVPQISNVTNVLTMPQAILTSSVQTNSAAIPDQKAITGNTPSASNSGPAVPIPVFTLAIRPQSGIQIGSPPEPLLGPQVSAAQSMNAQTPAQQTSTQDPSIQQQPVSPSAPVTNVETIPDAKAATTATPDQTALAAPLNVSPSQPAPAPSNAANNTVQSSTAVTSAQPITKSDVGASNSDGKPSDGQGSDRQAAAAFVESSISVTPAAGPPTQFSVQHAQPVTEYVSPQNTPAAHPNAPVTDLRLQIDGASNQQVSVRMVQEPEGLRMTVHSNDPVLTQSLRDHASELTAKLEQHHYETEMLLPKSNDSQSLSTANTRANLQQDFSGRQQGSGGQPNQQNKPNEQQKQQPRNEDENFTALLEFRS